MLAEVKAFWNAISGKVRELIRAETSNALRLQRFDVTTAPDGGVIGVRQPYGTGEIFIPYSLEVESAAVGDTVLVAWWGGMSNAKAYYFADGYRGVRVPEAFDSLPFPLGNPSPGASALWARGDHVHAMPSADDVGAVSMVKLWENAAPTSNFAAQTVAMDLSGFDGVLVHYRFSTSSAYSMTAEGRIGSGGILLVFVNSNTSAQGARPASLSAAGIDFDNARAGTSTVANQYAIPTEIWGIKHPA